MLAEDMSPQGLRQRTFLLHSRQHELHVLTGFPWQPNPIGVMWSGPGGYYDHNGSGAEVKVPKLRNPQYYKGLLANLPNLCPRERHHLYYPGRETNLPSATGQRHYLRIPRLFAYGAGQKLSQGIWEPDGELSPHSVPLCHHHPSPAGLSSPVLTHW